MNGHATPCAGDTRGNATEQLPQALCEAARAVLSALDGRDMTIGERGATGGSLALFSIFGTVPMELSNALLQELDLACVKSVIVARCLGAILGMVAGDAVGAPLEFLDVVDEPGTGVAAFDTGTFEYRGATWSKASFDPLQQGQWTDDSSMALCLADSLLVKQRFDGSDCVKRLWSWMAQGYNTPFRHDDKRAGDPQTRAFMIEAGLDANANLMSVGCGKGTKEVLLPLEEGQEPPAEASSEKQFDGNGAIIRLAPIPLFCSMRPDEGECVRMAQASARTTHTGAAAAQAAGFLAFAMRRAIIGQNNPSA